jgi:23S rRNA (uracil1939-C5)-methyltransferase
MTDEDEWLEVESLDIEGQGIARRADGKVVFVDGALPGERVQVQVQRRKNQWEQGTIRNLRRESTLRVRPACPHFGLHAGACGGCKMQHLDASAQVAVKQRVLEDNLWHLAKVRPAQILRAIHGPSWGYRYRARLSVRHVLKKGVVLVGFHERKSRYVADMLECHVMPRRISDMLPALRSLVAGMDQRDRIPQIELAMGDAVLALVLRHLEPLTAADIARLREFSAQHDVQWWLQSKGPDSVQRLDSSRADLGYDLPAFGLHMRFAPTDFTQVNPYVNEVLVARAVRMLDPRPDEHVIDWFCGLGNFTLALARRSMAVVGIEGSPALVERAIGNAESNGLGLRARFEARDLFALTPDALASLVSAQCWLVDPPREGAFALVKALVDLVAAQKGPAPWRMPRRIVYVSCNPATLARDAGLLVHQAGYECTHAGVVNMFPHTAHVESIAVFDRLAVP